jgi:hypothetical protein
MNGHCVFLQLNSELLVYYIILYLCPASGPIVPGINAFAVEVRVKNE